MKPDDYKRAAEYAAKKADRRSANDRRLDDLNLKACFLDMVELLAELREMYDQPEEYKRRVDTSRGGRRTSYPRGHTERG